MDDSHCYPAWYRTYDSSFTPTMSTTAATIVTTVASTENALPPEGSGGDRTIYVNGAPFSNPLYFKTPLIPFLAAWPLTFLCLVIYVYNLVKYRHAKVTIKMIFFPVLLISGILDNAYDFVTDAKVSEYKAAPLMVLIVVFSVLALVSMGYLAAYTVESLKHPSDTPLALGDGGDVVLYSRLANNDSDDDDTEKVRITRQKDPGRWYKLINEYLTGNVIWALTTYNILITLVYVARYISHTDENYIREMDVAILSCVLLIVLGGMALVDYFLFKNPANGSVFLQYGISAVFALNFTLDFYGQVKFCEIITLVAVFAAFFMMVYKIKVFIDIGARASKKAQ